MDGETDKGTEGTDKESLCHGMCQPADVWFYFLLYNYESFYHFPVSISSQLAGIASF